MSLPERQPLKFITAPNELGIVAAGVSIGQTQPGVELGPKSLMGDFLPSVLTNTLGFTLHGDIEERDWEPLHPRDHIGNSQTERAREVSEITQRLSDQVRDHVKLGRMVLTLGGDHSVAFGSVSGSARATHETLGAQRKLGVVWVDAHGDINTPETSGSSNTHGMPLAFLSGLARSSGPGVFDWIKEEHRISLDKLVYIGIRDIDDAEREVMKQNSIKAFTPFDITHLGIKTVMDDILNYLGPDTPIHLGFDVDGLDPAIAQSTGLLVPGGLSFREGQYVCERLHRSGQLVAMDLVEVNPQLGSDLDTILTIETAIAMIKAGLGGGSVL